jgi:hypothetical protein
LLGLIGEKEKWKRLGQLAKKIGIYLKGSFWPLEVNHLFHSELAAGTGQKEKWKRLKQRMTSIFGKQKRLFLGP